MSTRHHYNMRLRLDMALSAANDGDLAEARRQIAEAWKLHADWPDAHGLYQALHVALDEHERRDGDPQALADLVALEGGPDFAAALRASGWDEPPNDAERNETWAQWRARELVRLTRRIAEPRGVTVTARPNLPSPVAAQIIINGTEVQLTAADVEELLERQRARERRTQRLGEGTLTLTAADGQSATFGTAGGTIETQRSRGMRADAIIIDDPVRMPAQPRPGLADVEALLERLYPPASPPSPRNRAERRAAERAQRSRLSPGRQREILEQLTASRQEPSRADVQEWLTRDPGLRPAKAPDEGGTR